MKKLKKKIVKHLRGDIKGFKKEARDDINLIEADSAGKKRVTPKKVKEHLKEDIKYYKKEAGKDKKLLKSIRKKKKK